MDQRHILQNELAHGIESGALSLHYQPRVDLRTGIVTEVEALVRWEHPQRGMLAPIEFIPLAEETGLIVPLGEWVLRTACAQAKAWQLTRAHSLRMCVNVSYVQLRHAGFFDAVKAALGYTGLKPQALGFEFTETTMMRDMQRSLQTIDQLRALGVRLALDNFGTGYSSLSSLARLPIELIQVDRGFAIGLKDDADNQAILSSIIAMAHSLNMSVLAEGVQDEGQTAWLKERRCDMIQGYLVSKPLPADELPRYLQTQERLDAKPSWH